MRQDERDGRTPSRGPHRRAGNVRESILVVASRQFATAGFHATTTRDIAAEVGVKQPALFHHFTSKAQIMETLQRADLLGSIRFYRDAASMDPSPAVQLYLALYQEVLHLLLGPYDFRGTSTWATLNDPAFGAARQWWNQLQMARTSLIAKGVGSGDFIDIDPAFANQAIESAIEGMGPGTLSFGSQADSAQQLVSLLVRAILSDQNDLDPVRDRALQVYGQRELHTDEGETRTT